MHMHYNAKNAKKGSTDRQTAEHDDKKRFKAL
jgi:hypothetical protein